MDTGKFYKIIKVYKFGICALPMKLCSKLLCTKNRKICMKYEKMLQFTDIAFLAYITVNCKQKHKKCEKFQKLLVKILLIV